MQNLFCFPLAAGVLKLVFLCLLALVTFSPQPVFSAASKALLASSAVPDIVEASQQETSTPEADLITSNIPPGFEYLMEPQTTQVDVFYGGRFIVSTMATYSPGTVELLTPDAIVKLIPGVMNPEKLTTYLSQELNSNASEICRNQFDGDCGRLAPEVIAVIFDDATFRLDVFISPNELAVIIPDKPKFLPVSSSGLSVIHGLSASYSKPEGNEDNYSVNGNTIVGLNASRLRLRSNLSKANDFMIDVAAFEHDEAGFSYQAGLLETDNQHSVFLPNLQITGARFASTLDTRSDHDFSEGSLISVFLTNRSRVEIYKDDRLVSSDMYDAGNQSLNTVNLGSGAYLITLKIYEGARLIREEQRFYKKSGRIPPRDQDLFFIEAGRMMAQRSSGRELFQTRDDHLLRGGYASQIADGFSLDGSVALTKYDSLVEAGAYYLHEYFDIDTSISLNQYQDMGLYANVNARWQNLFVNFNYRSVKLADEERDDEQEQLYLLGNGSQEQFSFRVSHPFYSGRLSMESRYNDSAFGSTVTRTASAILPRFRFNDKTDLLTTVEISKQDNEWQGLVRFSLDFREPRTLYRLTSSRQQFEAGKHAHNTQGTVSWSDRDLFESELDITANVQSTGQRHQADVSSNWASRHGRLTATLDQSHAKDTGGTAGFSTGLSTAIIGDKHGVLLGGAELNESAVVIDIESAHKGSNFDVLADNNIVAKAKSGSATLVNLRPFEQYEVSIQDTGTDLLDYSQRKETVTLYPGNVTRLTYKAEKVLVAFGRLVDVTGQSIQNAVIEGMVGIAATDEYGFFQAEMRDLTKDLIVRYKSSQCQVTLPVYKVENQVARLGTLTCR